jgi:hypothetical protein
VHGGANSASANSRAAKTDPAGPETTNTGRLSSPRLFGHAIALWTAPIGVSSGTAPRSNADSPRSNGSGARHPHDAHNGRVRARRAPPEAVSS